MKSYNNELVVNRNEEFTMSKQLLNKDGSPYILPLLDNTAYFLITVSNSRYEQQYRYVYRKWLDFSSMPRFKITTAINIADITYNASGEPGGTFDNITTRNERHISIPGLPSIEELCIGYSGTYPSMIFYDIDAVYYEDNEGIRTYKYATVVGNQETGTLVWHDYNAPIITTTFTTDVTSKWVEQNYFYSIQLVSGQSTVDYLQTLCSLNNISYVQYSDYDGTYEEYIKELYDKLVAAGVTFDKNFDYNMLIAIPFATCKPILEPTKIKVVSNLEGGL